MAKTNIEREAGQEGSLREGLEAAIRERVREIIELTLEEEVETALGASRSQRVVVRSGYRHGRKGQRLTLRTGTVALQVPRARLVDAEGSEREWQSQLVPRYRRSSPSLTVVQKSGPSLQCPRLLAANEGLWPKKSPCD